jgi:F420-dependent oxidoreductase-like protein
MRLGLSLGNWRTRARENLELTLEAERLGFTSVWTEEAYGSDAVSPLAWLAAKTTVIQIGSAVWQIPARTPAMTAMTAATLDLLSGGRFILGLGTSGPQVVEGWHGQNYGHPVERTREYVAIVRMILKREAPLEFHGRFYEIPLADGTGQGKPLRLSMQPLRSQIPVYIGALGPKNVELTAEIADGWLPIFMAPARFEAAFGAQCRRGFAAANCEKGIGNGFDVAATVPVVLGTDAAECRDALRPKIALYIGGMGSLEMNFSNRLIQRFGYVDEALRVQDLFLSGDRPGAAAAVPDRLIDEIALCGPPSRIAELLEQWKASPVTTMVLDTEQTDALKLIAGVMKV